MREQIPIGTALALQADWARDGVRVVYVRPVAPGAGVWITDPAGGTDTLLKVSGAAVSGAFPRWSPTSDLIALANKAIYAVAADGSSMSMLAQPPMGHAYNHPRWFPDGQAIALTDVGGTTTRTLVMSATGGNVRALPLSIGDSEALSPDGKEVILQAVAGDDSSRRSLVLYRRGLWDTNGSTLVQLTFASDRNPATYREAAHAQGSATDYLEHTVVSGHALRQSGLVSRPVRCVPATWRDR